MVNKIPTKTLNLSLPLEIYKDIDRLSRQKNFPREEILRWALKQHIASEKIWKQIYKWGKESAKNLGIKSEEDVNRIIHQFRKEYNRTNFKVKT